jgi:hypothetical protein
MRKLIATLARIGGELKVVRKELEQRKAGYPDMYKAINAARDTCLMASKELENTVKKTGVK